MVKIVSVCFYFQVHQPYRLRNYSVFDIGENSNYFDDQKNEFIMKKVMDKCYLPTNKAMLDLLHRHPEFKVSYSLSGVFLQQLEEYAPEGIESFRDLVKTGRVELLSETYHHSLAFLYSKKEFEEQVKLHKKKIRSLFNYTPQVFRNTELIYNNDLAQHVQKMGYKGVIAEGADQILGWRSSNFLYRPKDMKIALLLKNYRLSDDIAFRFSQESWKDFPLTTEKYAQWINSINGNGEIVNLFMDYETFGEHQWESTGIFEFLKYLPEQILKHPDNNFMTPTEVIKKYKPVAELDVPQVISWADIERDVSAWLGNRMQQSSIQKTYDMEDQVKKAKDKKLLEDWRKLQTSDHFYYMCTKWFNDGDVHKYFNPYESPYDAFIAYMNALEDFDIRLREKTEKIAEKQELSIL